MFISVLDEPAHLGSEKKHVFFLPSPLRIAADFRKKQLISRDKRNVLTKTCLFQEKSFPAMFFFSFFSGRCLINFF